MVLSDKLFAGSIPEVYDRFLAPLTFESCAEDLAARVARVHPKLVLETAAGTGALTRALARRLPAGACILATDLNPPMLDHAAPGLGHDHRVTWQQADALALPFLEWRGYRVVALPLGAGLA
jgi:ubiquinone/menaquinone biosynthesis C-methylase UbiE